MDGIVYSIIMYAAAGLIIIWIAGALYLDLASTRWHGVFLVVLWFAAVVAMFAFSTHLSQFLLELVLLFALVFWWWLSLKPSQHRNWDPNYSQVPKVCLEGDLITIENVRNTEYRTYEDYTTCYETRRYHLSRMCGVDVMIMYWGSPWMCHPMFVFDFGVDGRICISIEVRYRVGQKYDFLRSLYRQQEIIYQVCDERDAILRRTKFLEGHDIYLYRGVIDSLRMRLFFFEYVNRINQLAETPRWYNGLAANCTTGLYAQGRGRLRWDWRMLFNGSFDRYLYDRKIIDPSLPFEKLKELSRVNEYANRAPAVGFSDYIRREMPGYRGVEMAIAEPHATAKG